ncbi:MAG: hypothetical protein JWQ62_2186, partial [Lacunisphaera sp.]|nr:hypothetical protein [Lacunisphaera sp.]
MKTSQIRLLIISAILGVIVAPLAFAQSVAIDRLNRFTQTDAATVSPTPTPFVFRVEVRGGSVDMVNWGPAFYKPGTSQTPDTGSSSTTNTGTLNFPATANYGKDYVFTSDFSTDAAMKAFY